MKFSYIHQTPAAAISINADIVPVDTADLIKYENKEYFSSLCQSGCENYDRKWSCPPCNPTFTSYSKDYACCLLVLLYCDLGQFNYIKGEYLKIRASNTILKSQSDKLLRYLEAELSGKMISNGSCRLCKPCSKKLGDICRHPQNLRFSLESLGLNVEMLSSDILGHTLQWYRNRTSPDYSSVIGGVLVKRALDLEGNELNIQGDEIKSDEMNLEGKSMNQLIDKWLGERQKPSS
jgi:predicted metal-binding protein